MRTRVTVSKITFTGIANESQLEQVLTPAEESGCQVDQQDAHTKVIVTGTPEQIAKYIELYNA